MRIGYDIQAFSSPSSAKRGIGRYSLNMLGGIRKETSVQATCFSGNNLVTESLRGCTVTLPFENPLEAPSNHVLAKISLMAADLDLVHILSPMEHGNDAVQMFRDVPGGVPLVSTLFDLIPLIFDTKYLSDEQTRRWYMDALKVYHKSDLVLAISKSAKSDAEKYLGLNSSKVVALPPCGSELDNVVPIKPETKKPYFLSVLGMDDRKNLKGLLKAISCLPPAFGKEFDVIVVCETKGSEMDTLVNMASSFGVDKSVIFTGYVSDSELAGLYAGARAMVFPSFYEGLGLPIIEAMHFGCPVAASNASSIPELVQDSGILFDPNEIENIAEAMIKLAWNDSDHRQLSRRALERSSEFSWNKVNKTIMESYATLVRPSTETESFSVGIVSPWPPERTGIADYAHQLSNQMEHFFTVKRIGPKNVMDIENVDTVIYELGNSEYHDFMWPLFEQFPGIVEFHDLFLHGYWYHNSIVTRKDPNRYIEEMEYCHGSSGREYAENVLRAVISPSNDKFMVNCRPARSAEQVIVHSGWARTQLMKQVTALSAPIHVIPHAFPEPSTTPISEVNGFRVIGVFGHIAATKQPLLILEAFKLVASCRDFADVRLLFVGAMDPSIEAEFNLTVQKLNLADRIDVVGYAEPEQFANLFTEVSLVLNLRSPYMGESSGSMAHALSQGRPTIVTDVGAFSEVPDSAVVKVDEHLDSHGLASTIMDTLQADVLKRLSVNAVEYATGFSWSNTIDRYMVPVYISKQSRVIKVAIREGSEVLDLGPLAATIGQVWSNTLMIAKPWRHPKKVRHERV